MKWFKHFSNSKYDPKILRLIRKYGLVGYGLYFAIIEYVANQLETTSPLPDLEENCQDIAEFFGEDTLKIDEIVKWCVKEGLFEYDKKTGRLMCLKLLVHLDNTMSSNPEIKKIMENFRMLQETSRNFKDLKADKIRSDKNRIEKKKEVDETESVNKNEKYIYLAELLYTEHLKHDSKYLHGKDKNATYNRWANDIRMLIESDGRTPAEVENTIKWSQSDGCFWIPNILSGKKLREKFPVLWAQSMKAKKTNGKSDKYFSKNEELYKGIM